MPNVFADIKTFESWFGGISAEKLQDQKVVETLHNILKPFLLRRVKAEVEVGIPEKKEFIVYCALSQRQQELYQSTVDGLLRQHLVKVETTPVQVAAEPKEQQRGVKRPRRRSTMHTYLEADDKDDAKEDDEFISSLKEDQRRAVDENIKPAAVERSDASKDVASLSLQNILMQLRKVCNHPGLFDTEHVDLEPDDTASMHKNVQDYQPIIKDSGKMIWLGKCARIVPL